MVILNKVKSATLIETLVATIIIIIVFIIASLTLNNLLFNSFSNDTHKIETRIHEIEYKIKNNAITLPYQEEFENWSIETKLETIENRMWLLCVATHKTTKKEVISHSYAVSE